LTHEVGKHHLKFGWQLRYSYAEEWELPGPGTLNFSSVDTGSTFLSNYNPATSGDMWASSLLGVMDSGTANIEPWVDMRNQQWTFYAQDDLKLSSRITLNLGLRWERELAPTEKSNHELVRTWDATQNVLPQLQGFNLWTPQVLAAANLPAYAADIPTLVQPSFTGAAIRACTTRRGTSFSRALASRIASMTRRRSGQATPGLRCRK
jgi:outer membrane receptor protein involved in Fe transport